MQECAASNTHSRRGFSEPGDGLVDHPVTAGQPIDFAAHAAVTRADAEEGIVLLKNANAILPLSPSVRRIAIIGGHADKGVLAGGGSSLVYPRGGNAVPGLEPTKWPGPVVYMASSPLEALKAELPRAKIDYASGADIAATVAHLAGDGGKAVLDCEPAGGDVHVSHLSAEAVLQRAELADVSDARAPARGPLCGPASGRGGRCIRVASPAGGGSRG